MNTHIDVSIGPVQGFVAQSRRTRDLWGSSYLLSFLSAHAMRGAHQAGGKIIRPHIERLDDEPMLQWVAGNRSGEAPTIGSVPNHFVVEVDDVHPVSTVVEAAQRAFRTAWANICSTLWDTFVGPASARGIGTEAIWHRQLDGFWEIVWVAGPADNAGLLQHRKHWRSHRLPDEPGDKCMVMPEFQELSGHIAVSRSARQAQIAFWQQLAAHHRLGPLDLRDEERLCAVALVKRLYPKVAKALGWKLDVSHWRSTVYVGAQPWIRDVVAKAPVLAHAYAEAIKSRASLPIAEQRPTVDGWQAAGDFACLDANYFHTSFVEEPRLCPLDRVAEVDQARERKMLVQQLRALQKGVHGPPPIFYAILLADGDRLGDLVATLDGATVSTALATFTASVQTIVDAHDGVTIYAGGDDVLAMLPVERALECARQLSERYAQIFEHDGKSRPGATLSAAVVFAHVRLPLRAVLGEAHRLLEDVAKEASDRDSLAVAVLKRGGLHCEWASRWKPRSTGNAVEPLTCLAKLLARSADDPGLSSTLLHRLHTTLGLLCGWPQWRPGSWAPALPGLDVRAFLAAEVRRSLADRIREELLDARTAEITDAVVDLVRRGDNNLGVDALFLAHFLASGGAEELSS